MEKKTVYTLVDVKSGLSENKVKCKNITTGKTVFAYHIEKCGAAHNKSNTLCIGCIGVDLIPILKQS